MPWFWNHSTPTRKRLQLFTFEDRVNPVTITWTNAAGGAWTTASNWNLGRVPTAGDDVVIPDMGAAGANVTITYSGGSTTIQSLTSAEHFTLSAATLNFSGGTQSLSVTGTPTFNGATFTNGTIAAGTAVTITGNSSIDNTTINGSMTLSGGYRTLTISGNLGLNGSLTVGGQSQNIYWNSPGTPQAITGTGTITMLGSSGGLNEAAMSQTGTPHTITFGAGVKLVAGGASNFIGGSGTWENYGTWEADGAGRGLGFTVGGTYLNRAGGVWRAKNGGYLGFGGNWTNEGTISIEGGSVYTSNVVWHNGVQGTQANTWTNAAGTINMTGGSFNLASTVTIPLLGTFNRSTITPGTVNMGGTLNLGGGTLTLDHSTMKYGTWIVNNGQISNGTVVTGDGAQLQFSGTSNTLDGVTLATGSETVVNTVAGVTILNGLTLNGRITLNGANGPLQGLRFNGTQTLSGNGEINGGTGTQGLWLNQANMTLTIGQNIWIHGGYTCITSPGLASTVLVNNGLIEADAGTGFAIGGEFYGTASSLTRVENTSLGRMRAAVSGANLYLGKPTTTVFNNAGTLTVDAGQMTMLGAWDNRAYGTLTPGTITHNGGTLNLAGTFEMPNLGTYNRMGTPLGTAGTVNLSGVLVGNLTLTDIIGNINLLGGTLRNSVFTTAVGSTAKLIATTTNSFLDQVTLASPIEMLVNNATVTVLNGLTVNTSQPIGANTLVSNTLLQFQGVSTLRTDGGGEIVLSQAVGNVVRSQNTGDVLTIAPGMLVRGLYGKVGAANATLINKGTIRPEGDNTQVFDVILGDQGRNEGTISSTSGAWMRVYSNTSASWSNFGTLSIDGAGGSLALGMQSSEYYANYGTMAVGNGATLTFAAGGNSSAPKPLTQGTFGTITRTGTNTVQLGIGLTLTGDLNLDDTTGTWQIGGSTLVGGNLTTAGSAILQAINNLTLTDYTLNGTLDVTGGNYTINASNLTINATFNMGNSGGTTQTVLAFPDTAQTLRGTGSIVFGANANNLIRSTTVGGGSLTIPSGLTVRGGRGSLRNFAQLLNLGTIQAELNGGTIGLLNVGLFTNAGLVAALNGATLDLRGPLGNMIDVVALGANTVGTLNGGIWEVGPSSKIAINNSTGSQFVSIRKLSAKVILNGGASEFSGGSPGTPQDASAFAELNTITGEGSLTITNGRHFTPLGAFTNAGELIVGPGSTFGTATPTTPTASGLVSRYAGEGNANDSVGANQGATPNGMSYTNGIANQAFLLNGTNQFVQVPDQPAWAFGTSSFTLDTWVNFNQIRTGALGTLPNVFLASDEGGGNLNKWIFGYGNGVLFFHIGTAAVGSVFLQSAATTLTANTWYHVAVTRTGSTFTFYLNGAVVGTATDTRSIPNAAAPLTIGQAEGLGYLNGRIDTPSIWNRALSGTEINTLYLANAAPATQYTQTVGKTVLNGTIVVPGGLVMTGGTLAGAGTVVGNALNTGGTLAPGNSPGFIDITGDYTQGPNGVLELEIAGRSQDIPEFDRLRITGNAYLDGTVRVAFLDGFQPALGDSFRVLNAQSRSGQFSVQEVPAPGDAGRRLAPIYNSTGLTYQAQQVPPLEFGSVTTSNVVDYSGSPGFGDYVGLDTDAAGNTYVIATFQGSIDLDVARTYPDNRDLVSVLSGDTVGNDGVLIKFAPDGSIVWTRTIQCTALEGEAAALALVLDDRGNTNPADDVLYLGGSLQTGTLSGGVGTYYFGGSTVIPAPASDDGNPDAFLLKVNPAGTLLDSTVLPGAAAHGGVGALGHSEIFDLAVRPNGAVVVSGYFAESVDFDPGAGSFVLTDQGGYDVFVLELDSNLDFVRAGQLGGLDYQYSGDVAVDSMGHVWVTGFYIGTTSGLATLTSQGPNSDIFLLKLEANGTTFSTLFADTYGGVGYDETYGLAITPTDDVVLAGLFTISADFDTVPDRSFTLTSAGDSDAFILKLTNDGSFVWARQMGGYRLDEIYDVNVDALGNIYSVGMFTDTVDFDPLDGSYLLTADGNAVGGFIQKLDSAGRFEWAAPLVGPASSNSYVYLVDTDSTGRVTTAGVAGLWDSNRGPFTPGQVDFDPSAGTYFAAPTHTFLLNLRQKAVPVATLTGIPDVVTEGTTLALGATVVDADSTFFTYAWTVAKDGVDYATGTGPALGLQLLDQGIYTVNLVVFDETGNQSSTAATLRVQNATPTLHPTTYANGASFNESVALVNGAQHGSVIAVGNGQVLVGSPAANSNNGIVHQYTTAGTYQATYAAPSGTNVNFGASLVIVGDYAIIGAPGANGGTGAVYVYDRVTQALAQTILGPAPVSGDRFGASVAAFGDLLLIGAPGRNTSMGIAYLYEPTTGTRLQTFFNPSPQANDEFGAAVLAVAGNVVVGAPGDDSTGLDNGAAYVFAVGSSKLPTTLVYPNPNFAGARFGRTLAASGTQLAVGAPFDNSGGTIAGGVYLFNADATTTGFGKLVRTLRNPATTPTFSQFGTALAYSGNRLLVGASTDGSTNTSYTGSGAAYVFDTDANSSTFGTSVKTFKKTTPVASDRFGAAVAFVDDDALIGVPQEGPTAGANRGRVYRHSASSYLTLSSTNINENGYVTVSGSFADRGSNDPHTVTIDWRDGTLPTTIELLPGALTFSVAHQYLDDDPNGTPADVKNIRVRVSDNTPTLYGIDTSTTPHTIQSYDALTGEALGTFISGSGVAAANTISGVRLAPDGFLYVAWQGGGGNPVVRYDAGTGQNLGTFLASGPVTGTSAALNNMAFDANGFLYLWDETAKFVRRYDRNGAPLALPATPNSIFNTPQTPAGLNVVNIPQSLAFGPDGHLYIGDSAYVGSLSSFVTTIRRYDGGTGAPLGNLVDVNDPLVIGASSLTFTTDGVAYVRATGDAASNFFNGLYELDATTGELLRTLDINGPAGPAVEHVFVGRDGFIYTDTMRRFRQSSGEYVDDLGSATSAHVFGLNASDRTDVDVTITNIAPTATVRAVANSVSAPSGSYTLRAESNDPGLLDNLTYTWSIIGGTAHGPTDGSTFNFTPAGNAAAVTFTITDDDTGTSTTVIQTLFGTNSGDTITLNNTQFKINAEASTNYASGTGRVIVFGLAGNDNISAAGITSTNIAVELIGGFGNDSLEGGWKDDYLLGNNPGDYDLPDPYTGDTGADSLVGGLGNDTLDGGLGNDTMKGGLGNELYEQVNGSDDLLDEQTAGGGIDTISYAKAFAGVTFGLGLTVVPQIVNPNDPPASQHTVTLLGVFENLHGSRYSDELGGNSGDNIIDGGAGNDQLFGGMARDTIMGILGNGNDTLVGGDGSDVLDAGAGNDALFGGRIAALLNVTTAPQPVAPDNDTLKGGFGNDSLKGGDGNDAMYGGETNGLIFYLPGLQRDDDLMAGDDGDDSLYGGMGNDSMYGNQIPSTLPGSTSTARDNDYLDGGHGNDSLDGGHGNDALFGNQLTANYSAYFPNEDDLLVGGDGNDTLGGGVGNDGLFGGRIRALIGTSNTTPSTTTEPDKDSMSGGFGNDSLNGGRDNDAMYGGEFPTLFPTTLNDGNDTLIGGTGNDTLVGGMGNDGQFGGDLVASLTEVTTDNDDDSLVGGMGNDAQYGGLGNDVIYGGDGSGETNNGQLDDDQMFGGFGNDTLYGEAADDRIFGNELAASLPGGTGNSPDNDSMIGGLGNDSLDGGLGNDGMFGGDLRITLPAAVGLDADHLQGGPGNDTLNGGLGNDASFGGAGDDALTGGEGEDRFEGGSGNDRIVESADADMTLSPTTLVTATLTERHYDIEQAILSGGVGHNKLDAQTFPGTVILFGSAGNDTLLGTTGSDQFSGGNGNDSIMGYAGIDLLDPGLGSDVADGGESNDIYTLMLDGQDTVRDSQGIDSVDLSGTAFAVNVDLERVAPQVLDTAGNTLTFVGTVENVRGSSLGDIIKGNQERNILEGAGGVDIVDGRGADDRVQGSFPQVIYLDFDSATGKGEKNFTVEERNLIQARLEAIYPAPFSISFTQTAPSVGRYSTIVVNAGGSEENESLVAGLARELDWRNVNAASRADVNTNGFLGKKGQPAASSANFVALTTEVIAHELGHLLGLRHHDAFGPIGVNPDTNLPYGVFAGLIAKSYAVNEPVLGVVAGAPTVGTPLAYEFGHSPVLLAPATQAGNSAPNPYLVPSGTIYSGVNPVATFTINASSQVQLTPSGTAPTGIASASFDAAAGVLTVNWFNVPSSTQVVVTYLYDAYRPGYRGPDDAFETPQHVIGSPASIGTSIVDALGVTHLGERELVKLAFAETGVTVQESALALVSAGTLGTAKNLNTLPNLSVPNLLPHGTVNAGQALNAQALSVVGSIALAGAAVEDDVYAFQGTAGTYLSVEVLSVTLRHRIADRIDSLIKVYDANGQLLDYYGGPAQNDDGFDNQDAVIQDVYLPTTGTYHVVVDTYTGPGVPDTDTGGYELVLYTYAPPTVGGIDNGGSGDLIIGGAGRDILVGTSGDDTFQGDPDVDIFLNQEADDTVNNGQTITVTPLLTPNTARPEGYSVTVTATFDDTAGDTGTTYEYVWNFVASNGQVIDSQSGTFVGNTTPVPDAVFTPFDDGTYTVTLTITDTGSNASGDGEASVVAINVAPTVTASGPTASNEGAAVTFTGSFTDPGTTQDVNYSYVWSVVASNGQTISNQSGTLTSYPATVPSYVFTPFDDGTYTVTLSITDNDSGTGTFTATTLVVGNLPPVVTASGPTVSNEGDPVTFTGSFTDVGGSRDLNYVYTWSVVASNGQTVANQSGTLTTYPATVPNFTFTPFDNGTYAVTLTVTYGDGGSGSFTATNLVVSNVAPTVTVNGPTVAGEGSNVSFTGSFTDPAGVHDVNYTYTWSVTTTNGQTVPTQTGLLATYPASVPNFNFTVGDNGTYTVMLTIVDNDSGSRSSTATPLVVSNVPPTATFTHNLPAPVTPNPLPVIPRSAPYAFTISNLVDPGTNFDNPYTIAWDWNFTGAFDTFFDVVQTVSYGMVPQTQVTSFPTTGIHHVRYRVTDKDGAYTEGYQDIDVRPFVPMLNGELHLGGTPAANVITIDPDTTPNSYRVFMDSVYLGSFTPTAPVRLFGGTGTDTLTVLGTTSDDVFDVLSTVTSDTLRDREMVLNNAYFSTRDVENLSLRGSDGNDTFNVAGLGSASPLTNVTIEGGNGTDTLASDLPASEVGGTVNWVIEGPSRGKLESVITFNTLEALTGNATDDHFKFLSGASMPGVVRGGTGTNTLDVSALTTATTFTLQSDGRLSTNVGTLDGITQLVGPTSASDKLIGASTVNAWVVTGANSGTYTSGTNPPMSFGGIEQLTGGASNDTFLMGPSGTLTGALDGGAGSDVLSYAGRTTAVAVKLSPATATSITGAWSNIESVLGGSAANTLTAANVANVWTLTGANDGTLNALSFEDFGTLVGGTGSDLFFVDDGGSAATLTGGSGTNTLSYAPNTQPITVQLSTLTSGTATGATAYSGIASVVGGSATDTLVGLPSSANTFVITAAQAGTLNTSTKFSDFEQLVGGTAADSFRFTTTVANPLVSVNGGAGTADTLFGGNYSNTFRVTGGESGTLNTTTIFAGIEHLTGGTASDTHWFDGGSITGIASGGTGSDTLRVGVGGSVNLATSAATGMASFNTFESYAATNGALTGANTTNTWRLTGVNTGTLNTSISFNGFATLTGGTGADRVYVQTGRVTGTLHGGAGTDILDYTGASIPRPYTPTTATLLNGSVYDGMGTTMLVTTFEQVAGNL